MYLLLKKVLYILYIYNKHVLKYANIQSAILQVTPNGSL